MLGISCRGLDELLQGLVLDVRCGPFRDLIAGKVTTKLHREAPERLPSVVSRLR